MHVRLRFYFLNSRKSLIVEKCPNINSFKQWFLIKNHNDYNDRNNNNNNNTNSNDSNNNGRRRQREVSWSASMDSPAKPASQRPAVEKRAIEIPLHSLTIQAEMLKI